EAAALQKTTDAVCSGQAVDVAVVVVVRIEGDERAARTRRARLQEGVEGLLPCLVMHRGRVGEHTVEVEQAGRDLIGQSEHDSILAEGTSGRFATRELAKRPLARRADWIRRRAPPDPRSTSGCTWSPSPG